MKRWFWNGDDGEERFPCLSVADRWAPRLVGPMCHCLNGRMGYVSGSSSEERGGGFAMEKRERRDGGFGMEMMERRGSPAFRSLTGGPRAWWDPCVSVSMAGWATPGDPRPR